MKVNKHSYVTAHALNYWSRACAEATRVVCTMKQTRASLVLILLQSVVWSDVHSYNPKPNPKSVVEVGGARFTVLTERLVRMEWGGVNDATTFTFINRDLPTPTYNVSSDGPATLIRTPFLTVK